MAGMLVGASRDREVHPRISAAAAQREDAHEALPLAAPRAGDPPTRSAARAGEEGAERGTEDSRGVCERLHYSICFVPAFPSAQI